MNELAIKVNGEYLDLFPDTSIPFEINNPLFNTDVIDGAFSFPVNIPASPNNLRMLGLLASLISRNTLINSFACEIQQSSITMLVGTLTIRTFNATSIQIYFFSNQSNLAALSKLSMRTLDFGGTQLIDEGYYYFLLQLEVGGSGTGGATITVRGVSYTALYFNSVYDTILELRNLILADFDTNPCVIETYSTSATTAVIFIRDPDAASTDLTVSSGTSGPITFTTLISSTPDVTDNELVQRHQIYASTYPYRYKVAFFPVFNPNFYNDQDDFYIEFQNWWDDNTYPFQEEYTDKHSPVTPFPYLKQVVYKIFEQADYTISQDLFFDAELSTLCLFSTVSLDVQTTDADGHAMVSNSPEYDLAQLLPDVTIGSFLNGLQKMLGIVFICDNHRLNVKITSFKNIITSNAQIDWTEKSEPAFEVDLTRPTEIDLFYTFDSADAYISKSNSDISKFQLKDPVFSPLLLPTVDNEEGDIRLVNCLNQYYKVVIDNTLVFNSWVYLADNLLKKKLKSGVEQGESVTNINPSVSTLGMYLYAPDLDEFSRSVMPQTDQIGISSAATIPVTGFTPRLLFYRGIQNRFDTDIDETTAPLGTNTNYNTADDFTIGNYTLSWEGEFGLYEKQWKQWIKFLLNQCKVTRNAKWGITDFLGIDYTAKYRIDNIIYLIGKISFELPLVHKPKIDYWRIDPLPEIIKTQAFVTIHILQLPAIGETFTIHLPATETSSLHTITFTIVEGAPANDLEIQAGDDLTAAIAFNQAISDYLAAHEPALVLQRLPDDADNFGVNYFHCLAGFKYDGAIGNLVQLIWTQADGFEETSPTHLAGGNG